jgi:hypothetical protein
MRVCVCMYVCDYLHMLTCKRRLGACTLIGANSHEPGMRVCVCIICVTICICSRVYVGLGHAR